MANTSQKCHSKAGMNRRLVV